MKIIYIVIGCICVALGAVGAAVPVLPTVPFLMAAAYCFARSSERLNSWFKTTRLYKENLESFVRGEGMTAWAKIRIMITLTLVMAVGFAVMGAKGIWSGCAVLCCIWLIHILYFIFGIKTLRWK